MLLNFVQATQSTTKETTDKDYKKEKAIRFPGIS